MNDGDIWKVLRSFAVKHLKLLGLGQRRVDELIYSEYQNIAQNIFDTTQSVTPTRHLQTAVMNVLWELTAGAKFDDPKLLMLMVKRSTAFDMAGGLLNQIPWIRYLAPVRTGYSLITEINQQLYSLVSVRMHGNIFSFIVLYKLNINLILLIFFLIGTFKNAVFICIDIFPLGYINLFREKLSLYTISLYCTHKL